jgi:hypothetical protein
VCDHLPGDGTHVVHMTFEGRRTSGTAGDTASGTDTTPIRGVEFVPVSELTSLGFRHRFAELVTAGFPGA